MKVNYKHNWHCVTDYCHIIPDDPGCYAIYIFNYETKIQELIYIGTARNLKIRLAKHEVRKVLHALIFSSLLPMIKCKIIKEDRKSVV